MIAVTDHLPIVLRAYAHAPKAKPRFHDAGASSWTLVFDTETTSDAGQALRFGTYQLRNGETLDEAGLFFDPEGMSDLEHSTISDFAKREGLILRNRDEFVDEVFFRRAYQLRARIVGFNLPFDISRLAIRHGPARGAMYGGFTFTLSHQKIWPNVRIKHLSADVRSCHLRPSSVSATAEVSEIAESDGPSIVAISWTSTRLHLPFCRGASRWEA